MEIERKFLLDLPLNIPIPLLQTSEMCQGYLSSNTPIVRIRSTKTQNVTSYKLCFKGKGSLVREEIELDIPEETFKQLETLLPIPTIHKEFYLYALPDGNKLECNIVEAGSLDEFAYAEVEFTSLEEANSFIPPDFLGKEVTEENGFSMSCYWNRKKERLYKDSNL